MVPFRPVPFCPKLPFCPNIPCFILPPRLCLEITYYVNYDIARCSIKWRENANKRYIIIFNHMQWFYYLTCQSNWCQNANKLIYQKGEISFLWDTQNVVYCKFDFDEWRWTGRWQNLNGRENRPTPDMLFSKHQDRCSIFLPCSILPRLPIHVATRHIEIIMDFQFMVYIYIYIIFSPIRLLMRVAFKPQYLFADDAKPFQAYRNVKYKSFHCAL